MLLLGVCGLKIVLFRFIFGRFFAACASGGRFKTSAAIPGQFICGASVTPSFCSVLERYYKPPATC